MNNIESFSIICGTAACDARCPFCVSKMTGIKALGLKPQPVNWRNFDKACLMAKEGRVRSVMITGKGEPTLFPDQISEYLRHLEPHAFPLIDLQTNGVRLGKHPEIYDDYLKDWYDHGLAFVAISLVHFLAEENRKIYTPNDKEYIALPELIDRLHKIGLSARFSVTMFEGGIDNPEKVEAMVDFAKSIGVEQLTLRKIAASSNAENPEITAWTNGHLLSGEQNKMILDYLSTRGRVLSAPEKRARIFDVNGQNVCLTDALTINPAGEDFRQIIFHPDGRVRFDWQSAGSVLL